MSSIKEEIKNIIPSLDGDQVSLIENLILSREEKLIKLILFLREQVTDNCCHAVLDEDDCLDEIEKILK